MTITYMAVTTLAPITLICAALAYIHKLGFWRAVWCVVSGEAGVIPPSDESKAVVLDELRRCEQLFRPATDANFGYIGASQDGDVEMEPRPVSPTLGITTMQPVRDRRR